VRSLIDTQPLKRKWANFGSHISLTIFAIALVLITVKPTLAQERFALLIGNQSYSEKVGALKNPHNDIRLIKSALIKIGFKESNIDLIDDADLKTLHIAQGRFQQKLRAAGENALGLFYYSGHGAASCC